jgi:hypothetical protein
VPRVVFGVEGVALIGPLAIFLDIYLITYQWYLYQELIVVSCGKWIHKIVTLEVSL